MGRPTHDFNALVKHTADWFLKRAAVSKEERLRLMPGMESLATEELEILLHVMLSEKANSGIRRSYEDFAFFLGMPRIHIRNSMKFSANGKPTLKVEKMVRDTGFFENMLDSLFKLGGIPSIIGPALCSDSSRWQPRILNELVPQLRALQDIPYVPLDFEDLGSPISKSLSTLDRRLDDVNGAMPSEFKDGRYFEYKRLGMTWYRNNLRINSQEYAPRRMAYIWESFVRGVPPCSGPKSYLEGKLSIIPSENGPFIVRYGKREARLPNSTGRWVQRLFDDIGVTILADSLDEEVGGRSSRHYARLPKFLQGRIEPPGRGGIGYRARI